MALAESLIVQTKRKRALDKEVADIKGVITKLEERVLEAIEAGNLPESFRHNGARVFTRTDTWASPVDGDHAQLAGVLKELGLVSFLPSKVNSHSISAYVREHIDPETDEIKGLPLELEQALKITRTPKVVLHFGA